MDSEVQGAFKYGPKKVEDDLPFEDLMWVDEDALPDFVDWELEGAVNIPRNQGQCGSCWAHAAVGSIEALHQIIYKELLNLSVQSIIDCARRFDKTTGWMINGWGCRGGRVVDAYVYAKRFGLTLDKAYPLRPFLGHFLCNSAGKDVHVTINSWGYTYPNEKVLMAAVAKQPVVVVVDGCPWLTASTDDLIELEQWPPADDPKLMQTHAVLVVGYGTDLLGRKYWKIKNSYGTKWGKKGYAYLRRGGPDPRGVGGITRYFGFYPVIYDMK